MNGNHFDIHDLKREYEKGRKQGAVEELEKILNLIKESPVYGIGGKGYIETHIEKRLGELESKGVN